MFRFLLKQPNLIVQNCGFKLTVKIKHLKRTYNKSIL